MPTTVLDPPPLVPERDIRDGGPPDSGDGGGGGDDGGGDGGWDRGESGPPISVEKLGLLVFIGSLSMLFAGLLSGYVVYRSP